MKKNIYIILLTCSSYYLVQNILKDNANHLETNPKSSIEDYKTPLCIVYFQDVSGSIKKNGVEMITSKVFEPYLYEVNRDIELNFGIIDQLTADKLSTLLLPMRKFEKPILCNLNDLSAPEQKRTKLKYVEELKKYKVDSIKFYKDRISNFTEFCRKIDSDLVKYENNLSCQTDLITTIPIAEKVFNYTHFNPAKCYLIINSDGVDSFNRSTPKLNNQPIVILVNASNQASTDIDSVVSKTFQSSEQAIHYTLFK